VEWVSQLVTLDLAAEAYVSCTLVPSHSSVTFWVFVIRTEPLSFETSEEK